MSTRSASSGSVSRSGAADGLNPALNLHLLDVAHPEAFYLPDAALEPLSDCFAVVQGTRLPLHSQVLSMQSAVLRDLFLGQREGGVRQEAVPELSAGFEGSSIEGAACFLRLAYRPQEICPDSFSALYEAEHLAGVVSLARKLDARTILQGVDRFGLDLISSCEVEEVDLQQWWTGCLQALELCQLNASQDGCLCVLADLLTMAGGRWPQGQLEALASFDGSLLAKLLQMTGERAVRSNRFTGTHLCDVRANCSANIAGGFTFAIDGFASVGGPCISPKAEIGGFKWQLWVYPKGDGDEGESHLSVFLHIDAEHALQTGATAMHARYQFTALDQRLGKRSHDYKEMSSTSIFLGEEHYNSWGMPNFMPHTQLHCPDSGFLVHDHLLLRLDLWITCVTRVGG